MSNKNLHINDKKGQDDKFFAKGKIVWDKSEADVWAEMENIISGKPKGRSVSLFPKVVHWVSVAILFLLVGLLGVVSSYTKKVESLPGEHVVVELPNGSIVELNAGSTLKYYPLKWKFERKLKLEGEGYFKVTKGKKFYVESATGITQVLGTSFNIFARCDQYRVTCLTGKVKVQLRSKETALLSPNMHVELEDNKLVLKKLYQAEKAVSWKNNEFFFAGRPLKEVIDEIERQYAVTIRLQPELNNRHFGSNFSKKYNVE